MADDIDDLLMEADEYLGVVKSSGNVKADQNCESDSKIRSGNRGQDPTKAKLKSSNQNARRLVVNCKITGSMFIIYSYKCRSPLYELKDAYRLKNNLCLYLTNSALAAVYEILRSERFID